MYEIDLAHVSTGELECELARRNATPPWVGGYPPLRPGCIHHRCPKCMRRQTNVNRSLRDPVEAFVSELVCDKHHGCQSDRVRFYTAAGELLNT